MTPNEAREAVQQRLLDWKAVHYPDPLLPVAFRNEGFEEGSITWLRLTMNTLDAKQRTMGAAGLRRFRTDASIYVQIFTLTEAGMKEGDELAREIQDLFEAIRFGGVTTYEGRTTEGGNDGKWQDHLVEVRMSFSRTK